MLDFNQGLIAVRFVEEEKLPFDLNLVFNAHFLKKFIWHFINFFLRLFSSPAELNVLILSSAPL